MNAEGASASGPLTVGELRRLGVWRCRALLLEQAELYGWPTPWCEPAANRMVFARWLVGQGRLGDDVPGAGPTAPDHQ